MSRGESFHFLWLPFSQSLWNKKVEVASLEGSFYHWFYIKQFYDFFVKRKCDRLWPSNFILTFNVNLFKYMPYLHKLVWLTYFCLCSWLLLKFLCFLLIPHYQKQYWTKNMKRNFKPYVLISVKADASRASKNVSQCSSYYTVGEWKSRGGKVLWHCLLLSCKYCCIVSGVSELLLRKTSFRTATMLLMIDQKVLL